MKRRDAEGEALWARVAATVRPLGERRRPLPPMPPPLPPRVAAPDPATRPSRPQPPGETLDGGWDRRLRRGAVAPERTIDLHGHTLATAQAALDHALDRAIADDVRTLLVVTGKPPRERAGEERRRGLIRASIGDWLAHSRHAGRIAAVRNAHPRHGGAGALYLILRRRRG